MHCICLSHLFFFFNDTATTEIYTLSLHDALPIYRGHRRRRLHPRGRGRSRKVRLGGRLRDEPPVAWRVEPHSRGPLGPHVRHHPLAGEKYSREQRQGRHPPPFLPTAFSPQGAPRSS